jgi:hypothetical protein
MFLIKEPVNIFGVVSCLKGMRYSFDCHLVAKFLLVDTAIYLVIGTQHLGKNTLSLVIGAGFVL